MTESEGLDTVSVLIPKRLLQNRREAIRNGCLDYAAFIDALPTAFPSIIDEALSNTLAKADLDDCKAWISRVIRALPTQSDVASNKGKDNDNGAS